jgi:hypothetical protein
MILDLIDAAPRDLKAMLGTIVDQAECDSRRGKDRTKAFWTSVCTLFARSVVDGLEGVDGAPFGALRDRLQGYWINIYWRKGAGSPLARDRDAFEHAHDGLAQNAATVLQAAIIQHASTTRSKFQEEEGGLRVKWKASPI